MGKPGFFMGSVWGWDEAWKAVLGAEKDVEQVGSSGPWPGRRSGRGSRPWEDQRRPSCAPGNSSSDDFPGVVDAGETHRKVVQSVVVGTPLSHSRTARSRGRVGGWMVRRRVREHTPDSAAHDGTAPHQRVRPVGDRQYVSGRSSRREPGGALRPMRGRWCADSGRVRAGFHSVSPLERRSSGPNRSNPQFPQEPVYARSVACGLSDNESPGGHRNVIYGHARRRSVVGLSTRPSPALGLGEEGGLTAGLMSRTQFGPEPGPAATPD
jgi:hypothetical protein